MSKDKSINNNMKKFYLFKIITLSLLFYGAITFENAKGYRLYILITIFLGYMIFGIVRNILIKGDKLLNISFTLDIILIYVLEYYSRFQINYFFHSFYIVLLLEIALSLKQKPSIIMGIVTVLVSIVKYSMLIYYIPNLPNISQMAFFILISVFVLIITAFAQYYRREKEKKDILYKELLDTHRRLMDYADEVEKLTIIEERNRIARDIHDTLGHNMTGIIMGIEMADHIIENDINKAKELLDRAKKSSREGLKQIREVVETLKPDVKISTGITSITELIDEFSYKTGVSIDVKISGKVKALSSKVNMVLYRIIQEGITNAVRHGEASRIDIELEYTKDKIRFSITDNGQGCKSIEEGFGLKGMGERVDSVNGVLNIESTEGFTVKGFLPIGGGYDD